MRDLETTGRNTKFNTLAFGARSAAADSLHSLGPRKDRVGERSGYLPLESKDVQVLGKFQMSIRLDSSAKSILLQLNLAP